MPRALIDFMGYIIYFWMGDKNEPIHVHVNKKKQSKDATKIWITKDGIRLANNNSDIPKGDLNCIMKYISENRASIFMQWMTTFGSGETKNK